MDYSHITQEGLLQWKRGREREKKEDKSWIPWHRDVVVRFAWWWGGRGKLDLGWSRHGYPASLTLHVNENRAEHNSLAPVAARPSARGPLEHQPGRQLPISPRSRSLLLATIARVDLAAERGGRRDQGERRDEIPGGERVADALT